MLPSGAAASASEGARLRPELGGIAPTSGAGLSATGGNAAEGWSGSVASGLRGKRSVGLGRALAAVGRGERTGPRWVRVGRGVFGLG